MKSMLLFVIGCLLLAALLAGGTRVAGAGEDYLIAPADVLEISIWGEPDLKREQLVVRPDGRVSFPLVGDFEVAGKTTTQVKELVEAGVRQYIPDASAAVILTQLGSLQYFVIGKVAKPGVFNVSKTITVLQAMALAGGVTTFAKESAILIVRTLEDGTTLQLPFEYDKVKQGKKLEQNIVLQRGDTIVVP